MTITVQILGVKECIGDLKKLSEDKIKKVNDEIHNCGFIVEDEIKSSIAGQRNEPRSVDTGNFLNSVNTSNSKFLVSEVSSDVKYAKYLEFGTSKISPRRHFGNSLARKTEDINTRIRTAIK